MIGIPTIVSYPMPAPGELPANVASWAVDPKRAVLLIHDMQGYFLRPLADETRDVLVQHTIELRARCDAHSVPVAYTAQPGRMSDEQRGLLKDFWGPGMRTNVMDRAVVRPLSPRRSDWLLTKWRYSAFFGSELLARMRAHDRDQLIICGVYAHVGVLMTAVDAFTNDIQPFMVADAIADFSAEYHRLAVNYAAQRCAMVIPTTAVLP